MSAATCAVFFFSGAAALLFETLWFRQAGLVVGNTVWASSLVMAAFMTGLALGNAFAMRVGFRLARPLRVFAALELVVATTGIALVLLLPRLGLLLAPLLARLSGSAGLDALRLVGTFALLVLPASAMGATLPVLARSLGAKDANFGRLLGRLYGWNTLGAVAGALLGEVVLIHAIGVTGTAAVAAALDLAAAGGALLLDRRHAPLQPSEPPEGAAPAGPSARWLAAAFLAGFLLLALEVVWFRFLTMFVASTSLFFAVMLAVVLLGIALGGLAASVWIGRHPDRHDVTVLALLAGTLTAATYACFGFVLPPMGSEMVLTTAQLVRAAVWLMLPVSCLSGAIFTLLGHALRSERRDDAGAAGLLTLANTLGAMLGSLLAAFVLLPVVGMERSFFALATGYALVAALAPGKGARGPKLAFAGVLAVTLALFPFGVLRGRYVRQIDAYWMATDGSRVAHVSEGLSETVFLLRRDRLGRPAAFRLLTNAMGMSSTHGPARRYMGLFAWLPSALHPTARSALLISYGLGNTARALVATRSLERIDVVDVSPDVLRLAPAIWPGAENPLADPRVKVHIEDGRFHLLASRERYDIITGEPPPPKAAGIVNLYSREYFALMRARLNEGGIASYWLPVLHLAPREAFSVMRGFCSVFPDCSLWTGWGHDWILLGTRDAVGPVSAEGFAQQWNDPAVRRELRATGLDTAAELGATFLADADQLAELVKDVEPLVDDFPYRLDPRDLAPQPSQAYARIMNVVEARTRFAASGFVRRHWPAEWIDASLPAFDAQALANRIAWAAEDVVPPPTLADQEAALAGRSEAIALWALNTSIEDVELATAAAAEGVQGPELAEIVGLHALARRQWGEAEARLEEAEDGLPWKPRLRQLRTLAAGLSGDRERVASLLDGARSLPSLSKEDAGRFDWLAQRFPRTPNGR
jgi:predicted membrane-bound spermidine synthase